jgi:cytochrome b561
MAEIIDPSPIRLSRYSAGAIALHWTIAALIVANIWMGLQFDDLKGMAKFNLLQLHKSLGITVLLLSLARFAWRLVHRPPPLPSHMSGAEMVLARATHWAFYALMLALPLTGWMMVSASPTNIPTLLYKTVPWPHIGPIHALPLATRKGLEEGLGEVHEYLAYGALALLVLHVAGALKHHFLNRDEVLWRMAPIPWIRPKILPAKDS